MDRKNILIGTDEAGYGPNLGPLTVTGTLWEVADLEGADLEGADFSPDLFQRLAPLVVDANRKQTGDELVVGDSKAVYKASGSIGALERTVLSFLYSVTGQIPKTWSDLIRMLSDPSAEESTADSKVPEWMISSGEHLPVATEPQTIRGLGEQLQAKYRECGTRLVGLDSRAVFPAAFNDGVCEFGNKASLLSSVTLGIVNRFCDRFVRSGPTANVAITCDKHGGRSKYANLLQQILTDQFIRVETEALQRSSYRWQETEHKFTAEFIAKGESSFPVALSSMFSKYLREVSMILWNDFWQIHLPDIKPTKGYPVDAKRFKKEIQAVQEKLEIADHDIWRTR